MITKERVSAEKAEQLIRSVLPDHVYVNVYREGREHALADEVIRALKREGAREAYTALRAVLGTHLDAMLHEDRG